MPSDNKNIDQFFRSKAAEAETDASAMDQHWEQMQSLLSPAAPATGAAVKLMRIISKKTLLFFAAAAITGAVIFVLLSKNAVHTEPQKSKSTNIAAAQTTLTDTTSKKIPLIIDSGKRTITIPVAIRVADTGTKPIGLQLKAVNSHKDTVIIPADRTAGQIAQNKPASADVTANAIGNFYDALQKPSQEFIVEAAKGGTISCKEGTVIVIPPAAFTDASGNSVNGDIKINVEEFYKYSDMIAANLNTMSNGEQLVTGGMIKLTATQNGNDVALRADKAINLSMPAKNYDAAMQLFIADGGTKKIQYNQGMDTTADGSTGPGVFSRKINWQLSAAEYAQTSFDNKTMFMNMQDEPSNVRGSDDRVGVFKIPLTSPYSITEAKKILEEKYGDYYRKIIVKKVRHTRSERGFFVFFGSKEFVPDALIGDSIRLTLDEAIRGRYIERKDSADYAAKIKYDSIQFYSQANARNIVLWNINSNSISSAKDTVNLKLNALQQTAMAYSFQVKNMGWINCDRFYSYPYKTDVVINLPENIKADKFVSQLVFTGIRSVMPGNTYQNKIGFLNVPKDMQVYLVGLGEANGKVLSFIQPFKTSAEAVTINKLEETTPEAFREKLKTLDL